MSDLLFSRLIRMGLEALLREFPDIDRAVEEETGEECDDVARRYSDGELRELIAKIKGKRPRGPPAEVYA